MKHQWLIQRWLTGATALVRSSPTECGEEEMAAGVAAEVRERRGRMEVRVRRLFAPGMRRVGVRVAGDTSGRVSVRVCLSRRV